MSIIQTIVAYCRSLNIEQIAIILFAGFIIIEWLTSRLMKVTVYNTKNTLQNFLIGAISFVSDYLFSILTFPLLLYIFEHYSLITINTQNTTGFFIVFVLLDFAEYWFHRFCHEINILWQAHIVHHQSEEFNLSVGLRTSLFIPFFNILLYAFFPLVGIDPEQVLLIIFIQGFFQLLVHTKLIKSLGVLEYIFVTPSAHRVHHGQNDIYLDKNYGKFFIIWDHIFGTYQKETEEVIYGIKGREHYKHAIECIFKPYSKLLSNYKLIKYNWLKRKFLLSKPEEAEKIINASQPYSSK